MKQETEQEMFTVSKATVSRSTNDRGNDCHELEFLSNYSRLISFDTTWEIGFIAPCQSLKHQKLTIQNQHPIELLS